MERHRLRQPWAGGGIALWLELEAESFHRIGVTMRTEMVEVYQFSQYLECGLGQGGWRGKEKQQRTFGCLQSTCLAENTRRRNQEREDGPMNLWVQTTVPPWQIGCVNKSNNLSMWKFSVGIHIHSLFFPQSMLCIRTCPFKVHRLVKGRETCKLPFTMQHGKGCDKGNVECCVFEGR